MCLGSGARRRPKPPRRPRILLGTCGNTVSIILCPRRLGFLVHFVYGNYENVSAF